MTAETTRWRQDQHAVILRVGGPRHELTLLELEALEDCAEQLEATRQALSAVLDEDTAVNRIAAHLQEEGAGKVYARLNALRDGGAT